LDHADDLAGPDYWAAVADAWQDCERQNLTHADWRALWSRPEHESRQCVMTDAERARLEALPERVTVYRGFNAYSGSSGMSWTLDPEVATWFARRVGPGAVISGTVRRGRILALFDGRNESEVVVFPRYVYARKLQAGNLKWKD
jgi:hypothetical protein